MFRKDWCNRRLREKTLTGDVCLSECTTSSPLLLLTLLPLRSSLTRCRNKPTCSIMMPHYLCLCCLCAGIGRKSIPALSSTTPPSPLPPLPLLLPSRLTPPPGCKVSILDWAQASAQHHALSEPAQRPMGTLFVSISQLQFQRTVCICQAPQNTFMTINKTTEWRLEWLPKISFCGKMHL